MPLLAKMSLFSYKVSFFCAIMHHKKGAIFQQNTE